MSSPVTAIILAGGTSRRMGAVNKLLMEWRGQPVICHVAQTAVASRAGRTIVVTGYDNDAISNALEGIDVKIVHNRYFEDGLSTSLVAGITALDEQTAGAAILLADMPMLHADTLNALIDAFVDARGRMICVPVCQGRRGNPVLWPRSCFSDILQLSGDRGARDLMTTFKDQVYEVSCTDEGVLRDFDSPDDIT
ncbi:MAG: nucleotidyltransferase family protein [Rhodospirillaceae bacterium]|jgi:molybdenum cofactor cytidylyltransferase|nr:nucleotidyltransferase family protein [Rhodospirillaceae bacterium]MBT5244721.1 nucleotidyltransferase family protein [Rhodospirillaceae bacterium]MBT5562462.1 nucleotidyltransferase family protein [Rhodospirillaceae bacterium]MBT6242100.1 nucleotidyltransferase family protein [Rhodospirillaceae bacterium]MBT7136509.1 nucleotidyltransferase family protein [Rhodospirillaceae bacterium]